MPEKETNSRQSFFMKKCLENPELNIRLSEVKGDTTSAECKVSRTAFKLSTVGKPAFKNHSDGKKHRSEVKKMKSFFSPVNKAAIKLS